VQPKFAAIFKLISITDESNVLKHSEEFSNKISGARVSLLHGYGSFALPPQSIFFTNHTWGVFYRLLDDFSSS
jgi:hypothetical protein